MRSTWPRALVWTIALLLVAATLIPLAVTNRWWVRILTFPQAQIAVLLVLVGVAVPFVLGLRHSSTKLLEGGIVAALVYQLQFLLPYSPVWAKEARSAEACEPEQRVRVLVLNVLQSNDRYPPVLDLVRARQPDIFLALETDSGWARALQALDPGMPFGVDVPRSGPWGMVLLSRLPLVQPEVLYRVDGYVPSIRAGVRLPSGQLFDFYGEHPKPPLMHSTARGDAELILAGRQIARTDVPAVLAGDLNDVPWSYTTQLFQNVSGMVDPRVGRAFMASFKTDNPLLRWPLDHVFATPHFSVLAITRPQDVGSDHFPVEFDLCLDRPPERTTRAAEPRKPGDRAREVIEAGREEARD